MSDLNIDALLPADMARRAEDLGVKKAELRGLPLIALGFLAGVFIALGAVFSTTVATGAAALPFGLARLLTGLAFCLGLVLVLVGGAELFTGNNLIVMAWASRRVSTRLLLYHWAVVYLANLAGTVTVAVAVFIARHHATAGGAVGRTALEIARAKVTLASGQAIALGFLCNVLVCLAVWLSMSARTTTDRILVVLFPITAFVAAGFEHSIANMYFGAIALLLRAFDPAFVAASGVDAAPITLPALLVDNLLPVTLGNVLGGVLGVAAVYWAVFLRRRTT